METIPALRIGLLACSRYAHTPAVWGPLIQPEGQEELSRLGTRATRMRITHVWDVDQEAAAAVAQTYGARRVAHFADMVDQVDGIILDDFDSCLHFEQLIRPYLDSGVPAFVNRPLALNMADARAMVERAREKGTPLMSASSFEFAPEVAAIRQRVAAMEAVHGYVAANSMSDYPTHGIHGLWFVWNCLGGGVRSVAYHAPDWHEPNGLVMLEHGAGEGGRPFYGAVQEVTGTWGWIKVFGSAGFEQAIGNGPYFWLGMLLEMQRMFESRRMPQSYDQLLEKTALFLAGFRSQVERGGAPVALEEVEDWQAPPLNPDPYPEGFFS